MPIALHTGLPGAGKSLGLVERLLEMQRKEPDRPVYAIGIDGLREGVAEPIDRLDDWASLPHGSIIVVDECQEYMPTDRGNTPDWIRELSKHRHMGMDFILATQHPSLISTYVRRLVAEHVHHVRKFGTGVVDRYRWPRCMDQPETPMARRDAIKTLWTFPKECFGLYKSASVHTIKRRLPRKLWIFLALVVVGLLAVGFTVWKVHRSEKHASDIIEHSSPVSSPSPGVAGAAPSAADTLRTTDYAAWVRPRVQGVPWSAPAYDHLQVRSEPRLFCIAVENGDCHCVTEQGTDYTVQPRICRSIAAHGQYDPFKRPDDRERDRHHSVAQAARPASRPSEGDPPGLSAPPRPAGADLARAYVPPQWVPPPSGGGRGPADYMQQASSH